MRIGGVSWHRNGGRLAQVVRKEAMKAMKAACGNREKAAEILGVSERTMYRLVKSIPELTTMKPKLCRTCKATGLCPNCHGQKVVSSWRKS